MKQLPKLFSFNDLKDTYKTASDFSVFVYRAIKRGDVKQVKRGLYALVNPSTGMIFATKFQIASHLFDDAYFSYHDALEYYGLANQSYVSIFTYLTKSHARDLEFEDVTYKAKKSNSELFILDRMKEEGIRVAEFDLNEIANERTAWGVFRDRRIDLYSPILKMSDIQEK